MASSSPPHSADVLPLMAYFPKTVKHSRGEICKQQPH
uniref:Uncharacterized protein n=1 Tax=Anguilla anguilla TaxID=7936 RepID=A0A0E9U9C4_ANGAN